jgi:hypothetical protein
MLRPALTFTLLLAAAASRAQTAPADAPQFPLDYCTALPRPVFEQWDGDYARYERWLTPGLRKTQMG